MLFFFNDTATTEIYTLSLHDALPISDRAETTGAPVARAARWPAGGRQSRCAGRGWSRTAHRILRGSEEHTSELQSLAYLVCRLLLEKKKKEKNLLRSRFRMILCQSDT